MTNLDTISANIETDPRVIAVLKRAYQSKTRIRLFYGNTKTGEDWCEYSDVMGYVGVSTGIKPVFIFLNNKRSTGGPAVLTSSIVKITADKQVVYRVPNYITPVLSIKQDRRKAYPWRVIQHRLNGSFEDIIVCETEDGAKRAVRFLLGELNSF